MSYVIVLFFEEFFLEENKNENPDGNGGIGDIENRPEKHKILASPERKPRRVISLNNWKIKHIHHFAMQKTTVTTFSREKCCYFMEFTCTEYHSVKGTVNDISECSCQDERKAENQTPFIRYFPDPENIPGNG